MHKTSENPQNTAEPLLANRQQTRLGSVAIDLLQVAIPHLDPLLILHMARDADAQFAQFRRRRCNQHGQLIQIRQLINLEDTQTLHRRQDRKRRTLDAIKSRKVRGQIRRIGMRRAIGRRRPRRW
jgi:hypothetical protein